MLETAVWGTYYNVQINLQDVKDEEFKKKVRICHTLSTHISTILILGQMFTLARLCAEPF